MIILSIVIPCFNISKYIDKCIKSLLEQSEEIDIEILIIDDGSSDCLEKKIDYYLKNNRNIKYFYKENSGLSDTRNYGLKLANGKYIMFLDGDDFLNKDFFKDLKKIIEEYDEDIDIINFGHRIINENNKVLKNFKIEKIKLKKQDFIYNSYLTSACTKVFRREFLLNLNLYFYKGIFYEDVNFILKACMKTEKIINLNKVYYNYCKRENSITKKFDIRIFDIFISLNDVFTTIENEFSKKEKEFLIVEYLQNHHYSRLVRVDKQEKKIFYKKTLEEWRKIIRISKVKEKLLYIDLMFFKGIFGRIYFKKLIKVRKKYED